MNGKIQQLTDELEKELFDFSNRTEKQLESALPSNEAKIEKLQAYLLSKGMPPELHVHRISDEDKYIVCQIKRNDCVLMTISLGTTGIDCAELNDFVYLKKFAAIDIAEYEQLRRDFTTAVHFFEKLDYKALDAKIHEIGFSVCDKLSNQLRFTFNIKCALSRFKNEMKASEV